MNYMDSGTKLISMVKHFVVSLGREYMLRAYFSILNLEIIKPENLH